MASHTDDPRAIFPLARTSRRRRRLALLRSQTPPSHPSAGLSGLTGKARHDHGPVERSSSPPGFAGRLSDSERRIAELLHSANPRTWMFAGESFLDDSEDRSWPGLVDRFAAALRTRLHRPRDVVVDACSVRCPLHSLLSDLESRLLQRRPDVVFLLCGLVDASTEPAALPEFEADLSAIIRICREHGVLLVLSTCPLPLASNDSPDDIGQLVYNEALRAIAAEWELPLIDHNGEWEQFAIRPGLAGSWFAAETPLPGAIGHQRLAELIVAELAAWRTASNAPTASNTTAQRP